MTPKSDPIGLKFGESSIHGYMNVFCDFERNRRGKCFFLFPLAWNKSYVCNTKKIGKGVGIIVNYVQLS